MTRMTRMTRRQAMELIAIATGASLAQGVGSTPLLAQARTHLSIGTAGKGGFFPPLGTGIAAAISKYASGLEAVALITAGAADNMKLLSEGKIELALAQADIAWSASEGKLSGVAERLAVRTLFGTVAAYMHIVTLEGLGVNTVADLKGKRVSTGLSGSGTDIKALRVLDAHGITPSDLSLHVHQDYPEAAQNLKDGKLDAFAWDAALPGQVIVDLAATPGIKIRLLSTGDAVPRMIAKYGPFYFVASIPKGTYPGVDEDVPSAAGKTLFVTLEGFEESRAYAITKAVLEHIPEVATAFAAAKEMSPTDAVLGSSIPFHEGALRYYAENGITVPRGA